MKKYIIGLGCSWTQGEGGYPEHIVQKYNGRVQQYSRKSGNDSDLWPYEHENSWVNVLCRDHFTDYEPMNLGIKGVGNRAAVHQLHFCNRIDWENSTGIIVLMWSGFERLDFIQQHPVQDDLADDGYSDNTYVHYKWMAAWPFESKCPHVGPIWNAYAKSLWSEEFVAVNQMIALLDLQTFAKAHGFKVIVANAFNYPASTLDEEGPSRPHKYLEKHAGTLYNNFDWSNYANADTDYVSFVQKLVWEDKLLNPNDWEQWFSYYKERDWPAEYLTNCEGAHPTIKGYKVIADELAKFIKSKNYV